MALMVWNDHFVTGVDIIDQQHQWLIELINAAAPLLALNDGGGRERGEKLLDELVNYAVFHFKTEDDLMRDQRIDPRHHDAHLESHARFADEVGQKRKALADGSVPSGEELLAFLANWLIFHILGEDQALARQVRAIASGMTPAEAYERAEGSRRDPTHEALTQALIDVYMLMTEQNRQLMINNSELAAHRSRLEELVQIRTADLVRALDQAQSANRARSRFIANMSHEIRTPMNAILGLTWSLRQNTGDPAQRLRLDQVSDSAKHLLSIINDLLDMARIESDRLTLEPLDFDPARVLKEVADNNMSAATVKGLVLKVQAADIPSLVRGDPVRLGQILGNFASNAVKFTESGRIDLCVRCLALESRNGGGRARLRFEVTDTGPGVDSGERARLFQPFEQLDDSSTRRHGGTGLGLALSRRLAEMMDGQIGVDSTPGQGSTFWLELTLTTPMLALSATPDSAQETTPVAPAGTADTPRTTFARHRETLHRLATLLADDDVQVIPLWHESAWQLREALDGLAAHFESALAAYDFAAAHALLQQAMGAFDDDI
jgi:hemerythrin-like metal-binding protein